MHIVRNNQLAEVGDDEDFDLELLSPARQFGSHTNTIPIQSGVQPARLFYGGRFDNQALSLLRGEAPLVQNLDPEDPEGRSFDDKLGESLGAVRSKLPGTVGRISNDSMEIIGDDGAKVRVSLYDNMPFNQKSGITNRPLVKVGDRVDKGHLLAASNYTDDNGTAAMGRNARIGMVPYKGHSMDDAVPISQSFADSMAATQYKVIKVDRNSDLKTDLTSFRALFPSKFKKEVLDRFDDDGLIRKGSIIQKGDPILLGSMPRTLSSFGANVGRLSKAQRQSRRDASTVWGEKSEAEVIDVRRTKNGYKAVLKYTKPTSVGDKIVLRAGAKGTVSKIIPDDQMPRTADGKPLDLLLNPLSLLSRANPSSQHEMRLGKIAQKMGRPIKVASYLPKGQSWEDYIGALEQEHGVSAQEDVFDPVANRKLDKPVTVGYGFVKRLHHTAASKGSSRGVGSYDAQEQPSRGNGEMAQAKKFSGLENSAALSAGAYALMRENSTVRGQKSDEFWRALRSGKSLPKADVPFVWEKFRAILSGAGINTRDLGKGQFRLAPFIDSDLDAYDPVDVDNGELINMKDLSPITGGLFDPRIVSGDKWGRIKLPRPVVNPAQEDSVRVLLGLTKSQMQAILRGEEDLPEELQHRLGLAPATPIV